MTARLCPPCDGQCNQGRDCPAYNFERTMQAGEPCAICGGIACAYLGHRTPTYEDAEPLDGGITADFVRAQSELTEETILKRVIRDMAAVRAEVKVLRRGTYIALVGLIVVLLAHLSS